MRRIGPIVGILLGLQLAGPVPVFAGQLEDFQFAESAYDAGQYQQAAQRFEALLPSLTSDILIRESRVYLAASYVHLDNAPAAENQFQALLQTNHEYRIEEHRFSGAVVATFNDVRDRFLEELREREAADAQRREQLRQLQIERLLRQQERLQRLEELAQEETVERQNSRAIALLPFGAGQFQNDQRSLGIGLAVTEAFLFAGSMATWAWHRWLRGQTVTDDGRSDFNQRERIARISNQVVTGLFAAIAIGGIIEAQVRFRPVIRETRRRELPGDLPEIDPDTGPEVSFGVGLGTGHLEIRF
ncbi:MAG: hypothetical protein AAGE52_38510 [Myxococcota bacterium]